MKMKMLISVALLCLVSSPGWAESSADNKMSVQLSGSAGNKQEMEKAERIFTGGDVIKAIEVLRRMAEKGYIPAQVRLGELLDYAEQDKEAMDWYLKASNAGDPAAQFNLGMMYANGEGMPVDYKKALPFIRKAADQNYLAAVKSLAETYRKGRMGMAVDLEQAQFWENKVHALEAASKKHK